MRHANDDNQVVFFGKSCGINKPVSAVLVVALAVVIIIGIWTAMMAFLPLKTGMADYITIPVGFLILLVFVFYLPKLLDKLWGVAKLSITKSGLVLQTGRPPFRGLYHFQFSDVEVCDVEKWYPQPFSPQTRENYVYCVRAHMKNGHFFRLISSGDIRLPVKEAARVINGILAVENKVLPMPEHSTASKRNYSSDELDVLLEMIQYRQPPIRDALGRSVKYSSIKLGCIILFLVAAAIGIVWGGYQGWMGIQN